MILFLSFCSSWKTVTRPIWPLFPVKPFPDPRGAILDWSPGAGVSAFRRDLPRQNTRLSVPFRTSRWLTLTSARLYQDHSITLPLGTPRDGPWVNLIKSIRKHYRGTWKNNLIPFLKTGAFFPGYFGLYSYCTVLMNPDVQFSELSIWLSVTDML